MTKEKLVLVLDSSQLNTFDECPTMWHYQYEEGLMMVNARTNVPMDMGTYGHKLMEIFYKEVSRGSDRLPAMEKALAFDLDHEVCQCSHNHEKHTNHCPGLDDTLTYYCTATGCQCESFTPITFPLSAPERQQVKDRFCEYCAVEGTSIPYLIPKSPEHVEIGFSKKIYEDENRLYILEGRIDMMGQIANNVENGWVDHKWQMREKELYLKTIQFRNYALVLQCPIGVVNYVRLAKKFEVGKTFVRDVISFSKQEMDWWSARLVEMFNRVENATNYIFKGVEKGEQWYLEEDHLRRRSACSGKYGYKCPYTQICENSFNPGFVKIIEETDYKKKPIWRPW